MNLFQPGKSSSAEEDTAVEDAETSEDEAEMFDPKPKPVVNNYRFIAAVMPDGLKISGTLYVPGISPPNSSEDTDTEEVILGLETEENAEVDKIEENNDKNKRKASEKLPKIRYPLIVLLHTLSGDQWEWKDMPRQLVSNNYAVLAFDLRGHGSSVYQGKKLSVWRQFDKTDWKKMSGDIKHIVKFISKEPAFKMVDTQNVGLIGASIGANIGVNYAAKSPDDVKAIVLLSPGLEYYGVETFEPMTHYENAVYFLASKEDAYSADSIERLYKFALGKKKIKIYKNLGHGIDMLENDSDLSKDIISWLKKILPPPGYDPSKAEESEKNDKNKKDDSEKTASEAETSSKKASSITPAEKAKNDKKQAKSAELDKKKTDNASSDKNVLKPKDTGKKISDKKSLTPSGKPSVVNTGKANASQQKPDMSPILEEMLPNSKPGVPIPLPPAEKNPPPPPPPAVPPAPEPAPVTP